MGFDHSSHFTRAQLTKMHRQFFHPSSEKLFKLLKRAQPGDATPETLKTLDDINKRCGPCQRIQNGPVRFRVSFGAENVCFNERILMDVMYIDGKPVLHIVDDGTHFGAARFLPDVSTGTIWSTLLKCWSTIYSGLPNRILTEQGTAFGDSFVYLAAVCNVQVDHTGVEAHSSLGLGERYHQPLRNTFRKLKLDFPSVDNDILLQLSIKSMNDTLGLEGLVPSALMFGEFPQVVRSATSPSPRSTLASSAQVAIAARKEMTQHMAKLRVKRALHHRVPSAADRSYSPGDKVLVWREKQVNNRIGEWLGPFSVLATDDQKKLMYIQDAKIGAARPFGAGQVKPYLDPESAAHSFMSALKDSSLHFGWPENDIFLTEYINAKDPRATSRAMTDAKKAEIRNLLKRGTFKVILKEDIPPDGNVLPGRFVLTIKSTDDKEVKCKALYVIGGHRDRYKDFMVHTSSTLQLQSVRLLLALAAIHGFHVWTSDVRQAYLKAAEPIAREIFIRKPVGEFELEPSQCLQLLKPLYGLCESGDFWHDTLDKQHRDDLGMRPFRSDPALYILMINGLLTGLSGGYVEDFLRAGNSEFRQVAKKTRQRFDRADDETPPCTFTGFALSRGKDGCLMQDQHGYLRKLESLPCDASFSEFRSMRMKLAWLANTRPDCLFEISQLAQVTETMFSKGHRDIIKRLTGPLLSLSLIGLLWRYPRLIATPFASLGFRMPPSPATTTSLPS